MKILYLDCAMGAAGDMLAAALLELTDDREGFLAQMNALGLPAVAVTAARGEKGGLAGTRLTVTVNGAPEERAPDGHHAHRSLDELCGLIRALPVSERVRADAEAVYRELAEAEAKVHGRPAGEVHFHEAGALDAVADVVGVCLLMERLAPERIAASPVHVGSGTVRCAHGVLPVPAPAAAELLRGIPTYGGEIAGELCTPTGAALLRHFVSVFGPQPAMTVKNIGCGLGSRDFPRPNCLRAFWGETAEEGESVSELCCNLDDMTPEALGYAQERLWEAGALDVYTVPIGMKKNRPGVQLWCLCRAAEEERFRALLLRHTSSWGVRIYAPRRCTLATRTESVDTPWGPVSVKSADTGAGEKWKAEYEDAARAASAAGVPLSRVLAEVAARRGGAGK